MDLKIIQAFDSLRGSNEQYLKDLYQWLHETMRLAGKTLDPTEWCLSVTRVDSPWQGNGWDCGLFTILMGLCVAKRLPYNILTRQRATSARVLLLLHLADLEPARAFSLRHGPVGKTSSAFCT